MVLDSQVNQVLELLKKEIYQDGDAPRKGTDALGEIIVVIKELIISKKYMLNEKLRFLTERKKLLQNYEDNLDDFSTKTQLKEKYEIFYKNSAQTLGISNSMDTISANINMAMINIIRKLRRYSRENKELIFRIAFISDQLNFWENAREELEELENLL